MVLVFSQFCLSSHNYIHLCLYSFSFPHFCLLYTCLLVLILFCSTSWHSLCFHTLPPLLTQLSMFPYHVEYMLQFWVYSCKFIFDIHTICLHSYHFSHMMHVGQGYATLPVHAQECVKWGVVTRPPATHNERCWTTERPTGRRPNKCPPQTHQLSPLVLTRKSWGYGTNTPVGPHVQDWKVLSNHLLGTPRPRTWVQHGKVLHLVQDHYESRVRGGFNSSVICIILMW